MYDNQQYKQPEQEFVCKHFHPDQDQFLVKVPLKTPGWLVLKMSLEDLEYLHTVVRQTLQAVSLEKIAHDNH